ALLAFSGLALLVYALIAAAARGWGDARVIAGLSAGCIGLVAFVFAEQRSRAPMMPLQLFRIRTFSGINLLTLLLYGALGGAFFFLPFLLIQAQGRSATAAGAIYLPFTLVLGVLSRWSGGLMDRFGARGPLIIGPVLVAVGFALLATRDARYATVLIAMTVLGLGMAITIAPLTTAVLNAVPAQRTGVASGINNAVASVGSLLMIALLGTVALGTFDRSLDRHLAGAESSPALAQAVESARGGFVIPALPESLSGAEREQARAIIASALGDTVRLALWIACALSLACALVSALMLGAASGASPGS
ncbi:MAG TPA: MFS transporter, partial [Steroidobacteraceae bacterium]|nr:MFS transporter [Steroidobacteraceae bacterium]